MKFRSLAQTWLIFVPLLSVFSLKVNAQSSTCGCSTNVEFLHKKLKKTPAYKQHKKNKLKTYHTTYLKVSEQAKKATTRYQCFLLLNQLALPLNDNHMRFNGPASAFTKEMLGQQEGLQKFKASEEAKQIPNLKLDLDSLAQKLVGKPVDAIEGIYYWEGLFKLAIYLDAGTGWYRGVVLSSEYQVWEPGDLIYTMMPYGKGYFKVISGALRDKRLISFNERIHQGRFLFMWPLKDAQFASHWRPIHQGKTYVYEEVGKDVDYIKLGDFSGWHPTLGEAETFYASLKGKLTKKHLIVDLRGNGGGGDRNSDLIREQLEEYVQTNRVYLLINHTTVSNAEQFTQRMMAFKNCTVLGDRSNGTAAYEIKNSSFDLPCDQLHAVLTSKLHKDYLATESLGITPHVALSYDQDWVNQTLKFIVSQ